MANGQFVTLRDQVQAINSLAENTTFFRHLIVYMNERVSFQVLPMVNSGMVSMNL